MKANYDFSKAKRGAVISNQGKQRITIFLDKEIISEFRERAEKTALGYQTMINEALRDYLATDRKPIDAKILRRILREELKSKTSAKG